MAKNEVTPRLVVNDEAAPFQGSHDNPRAKNRQVCHKFKPSRA